MPELLCPLGTTEEPHHAFDLIEVADIPQPGKHGVKTVNGWIWACACGAWKRVTCDPSMEMR